MRSAFPATGSACAWQVPNENLSRVCHRGRDMSACIRPSDSRLKAQVTLGECSWLSNLHGQCQTCLLVGVEACKHPDWPVLRVLIWRPELNGHRDQVTTIPASMCDFRKDH